MRAGAGVFISFNDQSHRWCRRDIASFSLNEFANWVRSIRGASACERARARVQISLWESAYNPQNQNHQKKPNPISCNKNATNKIRIEVFLTSCLAALELEGVVLEEI